MKTDQTIYDFELQEKMEIGSMEVMRVFGGWLYISDEYASAKSTSVFVPFHNEFKP